MSKKVKVNIGDRKPSLGGKGNEPFFKSRRMWGAILAACCAFLIQLGYSDIATALTLVASGFGVTSWVKPK